VGKIYRGFRFEPQLYGAFKRVSSAGGCTVTGAFERFMELCVERKSLVFPELSVDGFESEARVLVDWLRKGKRFYRVEGDVEVNIPGRLLGLLPKVRDAGLRSEIENELKKSMSVEG
jgi:hypothetical protein